MDLQLFLDRLTLLTEPQIRELAGRLEHHHSSAADEVEEWRILLGVRRALELGHRSRDAALAAHEASVRVVAAATAEGIAVPDHDVTRVARAAAEIARAIEGGKYALGELDALLADWVTLQPLAAA